VKRLLEALVAIFLHPIAMILAWINIIGRSDLTGVQKVVWVIVCFVWGIGPILYILLADGKLW
jgi:Phospholipase_D-nuclease N-terminal